MENKRKIDDESLNNVAGGGFAEDFEEFCNNWSNTLAQVVKATETNTCPFCNKPIVAGAEKCDLNELLEHCKNFHNELNTYK